MEILKILIGVGVIIAACLSGWFWVKAAYVKVAATNDKEGVGWGGASINVRDHTGTVVDFFQTYTLQSKWNSRAALASAVAATLAALSFLLSFPSH
jgi:hypothetical protein